MSEFNLLKSYPTNKIKRYVGRGIRTIDHRILASLREKDFFDGDRNCGYGGFYYDGRWESVAKEIIKKYKLKRNSKFLQISAEKGFLMYDILKLNPNIRVYGLETSNYAISKSLIKVRNKIKKVKEYSNLKINKKFDFVLALGVIYTMTLGDAIKCLKFIQKVARGKSFITLATYNNDIDYWLFKDWTVLGTTLLKRKDWKKVLKYAGYTGDFFFTDAKKLNLFRKKK